MSLDPTLVYPLLSIAGQGPLTAGVPMSVPSGPPTRPLLPVGKLASQSADPNDLAAQRYGVVVTADEEGEKLEAAVIKLIEHRAKEQKADVVVYRVPPKMDADKAEVFIEKTYFDPKGRAKDRPRYLLILGDATGVSWDLSRALALYGAYPGRLCFDKKEEYEAYAERVIAAETLRVPARSLQYYVVRDGSQAIDSGTRKLFAPSYAALSEEVVPSVWALRPANLGAETLPSSYLDKEADELLSIARTEAGGILFSLSHGVGLKADAPFHERLQRQGALHIHQGREMSLADVMDKPFFEAGLWFFMACFSAGSPSRSVYQKWLTELHRTNYESGALATALPDPAIPFVAALPKAALMNPKGPLGVIGHVDLAWTFTFSAARVDSQSKGTVARHERHSQVLRALLERRRFGPALFELTSEAGVLGQELLAKYERTAGSTDESSMADTAYRWMEHNDLAAFVLLGDPAARLPITAGEAQSLRPSIENTAVSNVSQTSVTPSAELALAEAEVLEGLGEIALGKSLDKLAKRLGLSKEEFEKRVEVYQEAGKKALGQYLK